MDLFTWDLGHEVKNLKQLVVASSPESVDHVALLVTLVLMKDLPEGWQVAFSAFILSCVLMW